MNKLLNIKTLIPILFVFFSSCFKHYASIKIYKPSSGQIFNGGDNIEIKADLDDPDALTSELAVVTAGVNYADTVLNFKDSVFTGDASTYHLSKNFICQPQTHYKILIIANGYSSIARDSVFVSSN